MAKIPTLPTQSPLAFYSPDKSIDLSTLAMAISGLEAKGNTLGLVDGDPYLKDVVPNAVSDALDIFILMKRNPAIQQPEIAKRLHLSQTTVSRRMEILRKMACTTVVF